MQATAPVGTSFTELLARFRAGDPDAIEELLRRYTPLLREVVRRRLPQRLRGEFESLDFVQEVWTALCGARFTPPALETPEQLQAYLVTAAVNRVVDALRHRSAKRTYSGVPDQPLNGTTAGSEPTPSQWAMADERWESITASLPEMHVQVVDCIRKGFTQQEISDRTGVSLRAISRIVQHIRRKCEEHPA